MILPILFIAESLHKGKGVFTAEPIPSNTTIEISPVFILSSQEREIVEQTKLYNYIFEWGADEKQGALGMGYISIYNHNYLANCTYDMDYDNETISIKTVRNIDAGEELFINYNAIYNDTTPIWFDAI
ncbi:MAG: SET domain-containing protein-lysine N-methyltransferase [Chitinophagaceae bacterium]|nr:SET domain-containing protein-lysine N-methyltransferase [Chitinophagaceae bacterium]MCW5905240.1 SET domain-containing protein-lysine N-methyltransferase [Chitinophagaceae bacterium]